MSTRTGRDARTFRRVVGAVLLPIAPLSVAVLRGIWPPFTATDNAAVLDAVARHPGTQQAVVWLGLVMTLTMVPAVLAAARLARRSRPVLTTVAVGVNLVAYLAGPLLGTDLNALVAARSGFDRAEMVRFLDEVSAHPVNGLGLGLFVAGHVVGMILLGIALWRIIPVWAAVALIVSQPLHFVAFIILQIQALDAIAWGLTAVGFAACALALLRTPNDEFDLAPVSA